MHYVRIHVSGCLNRKKSHIYFNLFSLFQIKLLSFDNFINHKNRFHKKQLLTNSINIRIYTARWFFKCASSLYKLFKTWHLTSDIYFLVKTFNGTRHIWYTHLKRGISRIHNIASISGPYFNTQVISVTDYKNIFAYLYVYT